MRNPDPRIFGCAVITDASRESEEEVRKTSVSLPQANRKFGIQEFTLLLLDEANEKRQKGANLHKQKRPLVEKVASE
jgi:hypothetical protein